MSAAALMLAMLLCADGEVRAGSWAEQHQLSVTLTASSDLLHREVRLEQAGLAQSDRAALWLPAGLWLGARWRYAASPSDHGDDPSDEMGGWQGELRVGVALLPATLSLPFGIEGATRYVLPLTSGLRVFAGARVTLLVDPAGTYPHAALGAILGLRLWRLEVAWSPAVVLPLASQSSPVYDGALRRSLSRELELASFRVGYSFR